MYILTHGCPARAPRDAVPATVAGLPAPHQRLADLLQRRRVRTRIEAAVQRLIDALDAIDPDPDLEPDEDMDRSDEEPSLGWPERLDQSAPDLCDSSDREVDLQPCMTGAAT